MERTELAHLITAHQATIYRYLRYLGADAALTEDLVQDTFLALMRPNEHQPRLLDDPAWPGWLRGIARHQFLAACRKNRSHLLPADDPNLDLADNTWTAWFPTADDLSDKLAALQECLKTLPPHQREALNHRYLHHTPRSEMARLLDLTDDGVKSLLRRIRAALAQCIQQRTQTTRTIPTP